MSGVARAAIARVPVGEPLDIGFVVATALPAANYEVVYLPRVCVEEHGFAVPALEIDGVGAGDQYRRCFNDGPTGRRWDDL